jgi:arylsulfatase A-like enzyme
MLDLGGGAPYDHSYIGKWHLNTLEDAILEHPNVHGFSYYAGSLQGVGPVAYSPDGLAQTTTDWVQVENGVPSRTTRYLDSDHVDAAIARAATMTEPWFLMVGLCNPHDPVHEPPAELFSGPEVGDTVEDHQFHWMIEATDTEIGRLLDNIDAGVLERTTIFLLADNGTDGARVAPELDSTRQKKSLYEGGVRVPMIVAGPLVSAPGRQIDHIVETTDLFPTIAEIAGKTLDPLVDIDGVSFAPYLAEANAAAVRTHAFAERTNIPGSAYTRRERMVRDTRYKLIRFQDHDELYDLEGLEREGTDLLADGADAAETAIVDALTLLLPE